MLDYQIIKKGIIKKYCIVRITLNNKTTNYYTMKGLLRIKDIIGTDRFLRIIQKVRLEENKMLVKAYTF